MNKTRQKAMLKRTPITRRARLATVLMIVALDVASAPTGLNIESPHRSPTIATTSPSVAKNDAQVWIEKMSSALESKIPDTNTRRGLLQAIWSEAERAGLDPYLVTAIIDAASSFNKYKVSTSGARGYMQVPPYWLKILDAEDANLFHTIANIRIGCAVFRHYVDSAKGDLNKALRQYGGKMFSRLVSRNLATYPR